MSQPPPTFVLRIDVFAGSLVRFGVPVEGAHYQAHGIVHMLLRYCERNFTDWLGPASKVDAALGWGKPPQVIAPAMEKAGLLIGENSEYVFPYVWDLCSYAVKKRWCDYSRESYNTAKNRRLPIDNPTPASELIEEPERDLFGEPIHENKKKSTAVPLGYNTAVAFWLREWSEKYGARYTFRPRDGATVKRLLATVAGDELQKAMRTYLASNDRFYAGHELNGLYTGINKWAAATGGGAGEHGIAYAGSEEDLPTTEL